jgi:hypothetical protein
MNRLLSLVASVLFVLSARAADVRVSILDPFGTVLTNKNVLVTAMSLPRGVSGGTAVQTKRIFNTSTTNYFWISNAPAGVYLVQPPSPGAEFRFVVWETNSTFNAEDQLVAAAANTFPSDTVAYGAAASDRRYLLRSEYSETAGVDTNTVLSLAGDMVWDLNTNGAMIFAGNGAGLSNAHATKVDGILMGAPGDTLFLGHLDGVQNVYAVDSRVHFTNSTLRAPAFAGNVGTFGSVSSSNGFFGDGSSLSNVTGALTAAVSNQWRLDATNAANAATNLHGNVVTHNVSEFDAAGAATAATNTPSLVRSNQIAPLTSVLTIPGGGGGTDASGLVGYPLATAANNGVVSTNDRYRLDIESMYGLPERLPPMGFWTWYAYAGSANLGDITNIVEFLLRNRLDQFGWNTVLYAHMYATNRDPVTQLLVPRAGLFPNNDPAAYSAWLHSLGLKVGMYFSGGTYSWLTPGLTGVWGGGDAGIGSGRYYLGSGAITNVQNFWYKDATNAILSWGLDFVILSIDDAEVNQNFFNFCQTWAKAIQDCERPIFLAISTHYFEPWIPTVGNAWLHVAPGADDASTSITNDLNKFQDVARFAKWVQPAHFPLADHICGGNGMSIQRQFTHHCLMSSAAFITVTNEWPAVMAWYTNRLAIEILRDPAVIAASMHTNANGLMVWSKPLGMPDSTNLAVGTLATNHNDVTILHTNTITWGELGLPTNTGVCTVEDVYGKTFEYHTNSLTVTNGEGLFRFFRVRAGVRDQLVPGTNYLSDLQFRSGWTNFNDYAHVPSRDQTLNGYAIMYNGGPWRGLGLNVGGWLEYEVNGKADALVIRYVGIDTNHLGGTVHLSVYADGIYLGGSSNHTAYADASALILSIPRWTKRVQLLTSGTFPYYMLLADAYFVSGVQSPMLGRSVGLTAGAGLSSTTNAFGDVTLTVPGAGLTNFIQIPVSELAYVPPDGAQAFPTFDPLNTYMAGGHGCVPRVSTTALRFGCQLKRSNVLGTNIMLVSRFISTTANNNFNYAQRIGYATNNATTSIDTNVTGLLMLTAASTPYSVTNSFIIPTTNAIVWIDTGSGAGAVTNTIGLLEFYFGSGN